MMKSLNYMIPYHQSHTSVNNIQRGSPSLRNKIALSVLILCSLVNYSSAWDYKEDGKDWKDQYCTMANLVQSPRDVYHNGADWYTKTPKVPFTFLPLFAPSPVSAAKIDNFIYTVNATQSYGQIFAKEPTVNDNGKVIKWDANMIRFHYPSEHYISGKQFDLEMQIYVNDPTKSSTACISKSAAIAVFFKISETDNPFFSFLDQPDDKKSVDLSQIFTPDIALNQYITGYVGSDTIPPCTRFLCWYLLEQPYEISQKQLDKLKVPDLDHNTRYLNPGKVPTATQILNAQGLYVPDSNNAEQQQVLENNNMIDNVVNISNEEEL